ncbi:hypothetical protein F8M41_008450 [Gigaspora margarita]|uniref:Serine protease n=1 Tax=Gigaspora margarita TaxID=4874 RepID=A0A8H4AVL8_GIGMA|nr:hypothetical protein F8M41_008450 [Gigaspora margarita]
MVFHYLEPIDFGLIFLGVKEVAPEPIIRNTDSNLYHKLLIKDDIAVSSNGAHLCLSGLISHVKCGYMKALSGFASNGEVFHENIFVVSVHSLSGDSGGPMFSYIQNQMLVSLNGILTGGLGDNINGSISGVITMSSILNIVNITLVKVT